MLGLKILQSDWPRAFSPMSQEPDFSQIWNLSKNIANNINFHYRPNPEKIMRACGMTKRWHILINLRQFDDKTPKFKCKFRVLGVRKYNNKLKKGILCGYRTQ